MTPALQLATWSSLELQIGHEFGLEIELLAIRVLTSSIWGECTQIFWICFLGGSRFLQCGDAKSLFVFAAALLRKVDLPMLSMQKRKFTA